MHVIRKERGNMILVLEPKDFKKSTKQTKREQKSILGFRFSLIMIPFEYQATFTKYPIAGIVVGCGVIGGYFAKIISY